MKDKDGEKYEKPIKSPQNLHFIEGVDFYIEHGLYVFTEKYLRERGYCCHNGCRHCPYKRDENELLKLVGKFRVL